MVNLKEKDVYDFLKYFSDIKYCDINLALVLQSPFFLYINKYIIKTVKSSFYEKIKDLRVYLDYFYYARKFKLGGKVKSSGEKIVFLVDHERENLVRLTLDLVKNFAKKEVLILATSKKIALRFKDYEVLILSEIGEISKNDLSCFSDIIKKALLKQKNSKSDITNSIKFRFWLKNNLLLAMIFISKLEKLFDKIRVSEVVCVHDASFFGRIATLVSSKLKIPSVTLQHGLFAYKEGYLPLTASKIVVWGKKSKEWLIDNGVKKNRIIVGGSPAFDVVSKRRFLGNKIKTITLTTSGIGEEVNKTILSNFLEAFAGRGYNLIINPHTSEKIEFYKNLTKNYKNIEVRRLAKGETMFDFLREADLNVSYQSTTVLEALRIRTPVIILQPIKEKGRANYFAKGLPRVKNGKELGNLVNKINADKKLRKKLEKIFETALKNNIFLGKPSCSEFIAKVIKKFSRA